MLTRTDFYDVVASTQKGFPTWRAGQVLFNVLWDLRPDLSEQIRGTELDPFFSEKTGGTKYSKAIEFIELHWDDKY